MRSESSSVAAFAENRVYHFVQWKKTECDNITPGPGRLSRLKLDTTGDMWVPLKTIPQSLLSSVIWSF